MSDRIFGHFLFFVNEALLNSSDSLEKEDTANLLCIYEDNNFFSSDNFPLASDTLTISGQEVYYYLHQSFEEVNKDFSWALEIRDVVTLVWESNKQSILYQKGKHYTPERLRFWIYHTFFPLVLELRNLYHILHVGSVEIEEKPVLFSAFSYGGKSTLTNYFLQQGHTLLSDDSLAIDKRRDGYYAVPSYPYYRPYREVETLGYYTSNFSNKIEKVRHMYVLDKVDAKSEIVIKEVKGIEKFKAFHYSSFIDFSFLKKKRLEFFSDMARQVCVYKISIPWNKERLPEVYEAICAHQKEV